MPFITHKLKIMSIELIKLLVKPNLIVLSVPVVLLSFCCKISNHLARLFIDGKDVTKTCP
jgi:hypothetical protein